MLTRRDRLSNIIMNLSGNWPYQPDFRVRTGYESTTSVFGQGLKTLQFITEEGLEITAREMVQNRIWANRRDAENRRIAARTRPAFAQAAE